jgi:hypothetical protein
MNLFKSHPSKGKSMTRALITVAILLGTISLASAQAVNPARTYEQQRNSQPPADGVWHVYDRSGNLEKEEHYKTYRLDGNVTKFAPSGSVQSVTPYVDGSRQGLEKVYYDTGALKAENTYMNNDLNGTSREYFQSGELKRSANFSSGQLNGVTRLYFETGALKQQWNYSHGIVNGTVLTYGEDGQVKAEDNYQNGMLMAHKDYSKEEGTMSTTKKKQAASKPETVDQQKTNPPVPAPEKK